MTTKKSAHKTEETPETQAPVEAASPLRTESFAINCPSGFLLFADPMNIDDSEQWKSFTTAKRGHKVDLDGPEAKLLTRNERENMSWEELPDGVLRIFGKTNQETGIIVEGKKRLVLNNGYNVRIEAGPIDQSVSLIEDACRASHAGPVPSLSGYAVKLNKLPGRKTGPARTAQGTITWGEDGRPVKMEIIFDRNGES